MTIQATEQRALMVTGLPLDYTLRRHKRRKRLAVLVTGQGEVEVRAPWRFGVRRVEIFLQQHASWVRVKQAEMAVLTPALTEGVQLPLLDRSLTLKIIDSAWEQVRLQDDSLHLLTQGELTPLLEQWYRAAARDYLPNRLRELAATMGESCNRITIRGQKSRWGSCSSKGNINLNWRLMLLPSAVVDYVLIHELAHLVHMNHSVAFWQRVALFNPGYQKNRMVLKSFRSPL